MNSLSWFIYFIGFLDMFKIFWGTIAAISTLAVALVLVIFIIGTIIPETEYREEDRIKAKDAFKRVFKSFMRVSLPIFLVSWFICFFVPSRQTVLLIAASEIGERVLQTDAVKTIGEGVASNAGASMELLKTWIKKETDRLKEDSEPHEHKSK